MNKRSCRSCPGRGLPDKQSYAGRCSYAWCMVAMRGLPQRESAEETGLPIKFVRVHVALVVFASVAICRRSPPTHPYWGAERSGSSSSRVVQLARVLRPAICRCCPEEREPPGSVWIHRNWSNLWHPMRFRKASMSTNASSTSSAQAWTGASQALTTSERLQKTLREASELLVRSHRRIVAWDELFC